MYSIDLRPSSNSRALNPEDAPCLGPKPRGQTSLFPWNTHTPGKAASSCCSAGRTYSQLGLLFWVSSGLLLGRSEGPEGPIKAAAQFSQLIPRPSFVGRASSLLPPPLLLQTP
jgi:hypothetical protein